MAGKAASCPICLQSDAHSDILLIGGDKTGNDRWYEINVPIADRIYAQHLAELRKESKHGPKIQ
jgi:hypothetical protein